MTVHEMDSIIAKGRYGLYQDRTLQHKTGHCRTEHDKTPYQPFGVFDSETCHKKTEQLMKPQHDLIVAFLGG